jgi:hypothetical protein
MVDGRWSIVVGHRLSNALKATMQRKYLTKARAYCKDNRLCVVGMHESKLGSVPFSTSVRVEGEVQDGPIDLSKELAPEVERALDRSEQPIAANIESELMRMTAEDLVIRTRAGEQNAAALILEIGKNAKRGNQRALRSKRLIEEAISNIPLRPMSVVPALHRESRPAKHFARIVVGAEGPEPYGAQVMTMLPLLGIRGVIMLANGPTLIKSGRARAIAQSYPTATERHAFCLARRYAGQANPAERSTLHPRLQNAMMVGDCFGIAQKIQALRLPDSRISDFDPAVGWELGE